MEYKHNFAGVSSNGDASFENEFKTIYDNDCEFTAVSKEEYQCYLGSKTINYRICIQIQDGAEFDSDGKMYVSLYLVPCYRSLHKNNREELKSSYIEGYLGDEKYGSKNDLNGYFYDAVSYGYYVVLYNDSIEYDGYEDYDNKKDKILEDCANTYQGITGLIGFHLDRYQNRIGETGWDYLRRFCNNVKMQTILREKMKQFKVA